MKDKISALMDGELDDKSNAEMIDSLGRDGEALHAWRTYQRYARTLPQPTA